jgi:sec-independent protein translocase protein TatB
MDIPQLAFIFDSVGIGEWVVLLVVIMIVVGPQRLPEIARKMGRWSETFRRAADEFKRQIMTMDEEVHKTEADYMDYAKSEYEELTHDTSSNEPEKDADEKPLETASSPETVSPEYQDSYPSEGLPNPEQQDLHEDLATGLKKEEETKS